MRGEEGGIQHFNTNTRGSVGAVREEVECRHSHTVVDEDKGSLRLAAKTLHLKNQKFSSLPRH